MQNIKYVIYKDGDYYVSQCLNIDVSSFGESIDESITNLLEAVELYFEDVDSINSYIKIDQLIIGESLINA